MKLRSKTLLLSGTIILVLILILLSISQFVFINTYSDFENRYSYHVLKDEINQFNHTVSAMEQTADDWAKWDDAYSFMSGNNPDFISNNLPSNIFLRLHLNLIMFVDNNGKIIYGKAYDLDKEQYIDLPKNLTNFTTDSPILQHSDIEGSNGIINLAEGPMIIISKPVVTSHEQGPVKGTLIMGRSITSGELGTLVNIPNNTLSAVGYDDPNKPSDFSRALSSLNDSNPWIVQVLGPNSIAAYSVIDDIYGNPSLIIKSEMSRSLYNSYLNSVLYFIVSLLLVGIVFVAINLYMLDKNVLHRLDRIVDEIKVIGKKGDLRRRVTVSGNDELSDLALSINGTFIALQRSERDLEDSERKYRNIFENTGTAMLITDDDMTISLVNRTFENIMGLKKADIEGKLNWIGMVVPDERDSVEGYHNVYDDTSGDSLIIPKSYEVRVNVGRDVRDFIATFDFIPGTRKSLISLIDITDRKKAEGLLKKSLREKELLLREIHHRVKNSLQIISSLLSLQSSEFEDENIIERYNESENRIHTIALIHESLYQSTNISNIDFKNYIEILIEDIIHSYSVKTDMVRTVLDVGDFELSIETAIPAGLIINELVSNALKYAFKDNIPGEIRVVLDKNDDIYTLTVADNGVGLPVDVEWENARTLGLQLVNALVSQLEGDMSVVVDNGTVFIINFKELVYRERI
jgi:PAS domain S-box-containing protein